MSIAIIILCTIADQIISSALHLKRGKYIA